MKLSALMTLNTVIAGLFGVGFLAMPARVLANYGVTGDANLDLMTRLFGGALVGFAIISWQARNAGDSAARRAIVMAFFVADAIGFVVSLMAQLNGVSNNLGWSTVAIYLVLALGFGYHAVGSAAAD